MVSTTELTSTLETFRTGTPTELNAEIGEVVPRVDFQRHPLKTGTQSEREALAQAKRRVDQQTDLQRNEALSRLVFRRMILEGFL